MAADIPTNGRGGSNLTPRAKTTTTMKEIPFLQHLSPISLSSSGGGGGKEGSISEASKNSNGGSNDGTRRYTVATISDGSSNNNDVPRGAFGLVIREQSSHVNRSNEEQSRELTNNMMMASDLITPDNDFNKLPTPPSLSSSNFFMKKSNKEQRQLMLGLTSSTYSQYDDTLICTSGIISGNYGWMRITTRHAGTAATTSDDNNSGSKTKGQNVLLDLSTLLNNNGDETDVTTIVKTACFLVHPHSNNNTESEDEQVQGWSSTHNNAYVYLHVHMMTSKGAMIRIVLSYPSLTPSDENDSSSFMYPSAFPRDIGHAEKVCFPTPTTVVYTTDSTNEMNGGGNLYCIDLGDALHPTNGNASAVITRVWSNLHKTRDQPDGSTSGSTTPMVRKMEGPPPGTKTVPRKKARKSILSSIYTMVVGGDDVNEEYEYNGDNNCTNLEQQSGSGVPPIAAVTSLGCINGATIGGDDVARVATVHTDGSLCIWVAETTRRKRSNTVGNGSMYRPRLRIPSVQCIGSNAGGILPSMDVTLRGQYNLEDQSYQVTLCCAGASAIQLFRGESFSNFEEDDEISFGKTSLQDLVLPSGCSNVVDMSWDYGVDHVADLLVLVRQDSDVVDATEGVASLVVYPLLKNSEDGTHFYSDPVQPSNLTLRQLGMNHASLSLGLSASEELDRYVDLSAVKRDRVDDIGDDDMEMDDTPAIDIAQLEANIDRAGLLAILQPFGRSRPSALAVYRAMFRLGLLVNTQDIQLDEINPASIVLAMRNWKKRDEFEASHPSFATSLVPREGSPLPSGGGHHTKRHSNKSSRVSDDEEEDTECSGGAEVVQISYRLKWIRLLSEIRREEVQLNEVVSISSLPLSSSSSSINIIMRVDMVSMLSLDYLEESTLNKEDEKLMAALDELSLDLLVAAMDDPDCRQLLSASEALIYNAASKASPLVSSWSSNDLGNDLLLQICTLGNLSMSKVALTEHQLHLLSNISNLDMGFSEKWLQSPTSLSSSVSNHLAIMKTFATMPNSGPDGDVPLCDADAQASATGLISSMVESTRLLSLSRLIVVSGMPQAVPSHLQNNALRSILYSTALSWAFTQSSSDDKSRTVLDEYLSHEMTKEFYSSGVTTAMHLADMCIASSFSFLSNESSDSVLLPFVSPSHEPRVALRLLAPLVEYPNFALLGNDQKRKEVTAECLLAEAAVVAKHYDKAATTTSPKDLWSLASKFLSDSISLESLSTTHFNDIFECLKGNRDTWWTFEAEAHHEELLFQALTMILQIGDDDSEDASTLESEEEIQRLCTMQTVKSLFLPLTLCSKGVSVDQSFIDGNAWRNIPRTSMYNFVKTLMKVSNLVHRVDTVGRYLKLGSGEKSLPPCCAVVLEAVNDAITSITSTLPPEMCRDMPELSSLYSAAFKTSVSGRLWNEALDACISNSREGDKNDKLKHLILEMVRVGDIGKLVDMSLTVVGGSGDLFQLATTLVEEAALEQQDDLDSGLDYWGCLYTLHASRGNWKHAAEAMDICGKVTVSSALSKTYPLTQGASKKVMDRASLSAHACAHAVSLVDTPHQYIGEQRDTILTKEDIDRRAVRASALRALSMDECSPNSISSILKSPSLDTIDILARMGYYDHAIAVAAGVSSKRRSNPSGVDVFFDSLRHILCTYLVPEAMACNATSDEDNQLESRSKLIQMRGSSSACEQENANPSTTSSVQATMAMNLLRQYTAAYSKRCGGLGLSVASAILDLSGNAVLPIWLKDLCMFGSPANGSNNLFARRNCGGSIADPSALVRLLMAHHKYEESCNVVTAILSPQASSSSPSSRLPEKGSIDYVPYDLIDRLWQIIESIASSSASASEKTQKKIQLLLQSRTCMEKSLSKHFERLKLSEDGLRSARTLSNNA